MIYTWIKFIEWSTNVYKKLIPSVLLLSAVAAPVQADTLGFYFGAGVWSHDPSGNFESTQPGSSTNIDLESDLNMGGESEGYVWAAFEHFVPLVPNIRLEKTTLGHTGQSGTVTFNGQVNVSGDTKLSLDSTDVVLYYSPLDNWINLDFGLVARKLDGEFAIGSASVSVSETIPMAYLGVQFDLPLTGLSVGGDIKTISYNGNSYSDTRLRALYEMGVIGIEAGYRTTSIKLDDLDNVNADVDFSGFMLGAYVHF